MGSYCVRAPQSGAAAARVRPGRRRRMLKCARHRCNGAVAGSGLVGVGASGVLSRLWLGCAVELLGGAVLSCRVVEQRSRAKQQLRARWAAFIYLGLKS